VTPRRRATVARQTRETRIAVRLALDGAGRAQVRTGLPFFDHMLAHVARHGLFDLAVEARGDLEVDHHHTVEDVGICLGQAFDQALGDRAGIRRFGAAAVPMDDALATAAIDLSGRPYLVYRAEGLRGRLGDFEAELVKEFFAALATHLRANVHVRVEYGENLHHMVEALFKAAGRALDQATALDPRVRGIPSTKGRL
jgi:imidazoleglycerol-phosphate dehydratase